MTTTEHTDRPLEHWLAVARMGFEGDFRRLLDESGMSQAELAEKFGSSAPYISKVLNGRSGNYQLSTMAKLARAIGAVVQIRLTKEDGEVVRVVDYETAALLDGVRQDQAPAVKNASSTVQTVARDFGVGELANVVPFSLNASGAGKGRVAHG